MSSGRGPRRFVVEPGELRPLDEILRLMGVPDTALADGRVFVDRLRVGDPRALIPVGGSVEVRPGREAASVPRVLGQLQGFVAADKPPELPTEPDRSGHASLRAEVSAELGVPERTLHAISRLDVGVSGVVLFAASEAARRRAAELRAAGRIARRYAAIAGSAPAHESGVWNAPVAGREAETRYAVVAGASREVTLAATSRSARPALLALTPLTGRTHQLRIHAALAGTPLLGDRAHGGERRLVASDGRVLEVPRVALHAQWVTLQLEGQSVRFSALVPDDLAALWRDLGGEARAWERAARVA